MTANLSVSLDGFYTGPNPGPTQGLGEGGEVLHDWLRGGLRVLEAPGAVRLR